MTATDDLRTEHEGVLRMLEVLRAIARQIEAGQQVPVSQLERIHEFLRVFVDRCHHGKEEEILFPVLEKAGMAREGGPIGAMLHEHDLGRGHVREMVAAAASVPSRGQAGLKAWREAALAYAELLTQHTAKENDVLFVMAERLLDPVALTRMHEDFERLEQERIGAGVHEEFHCLLDSLAEEYLEG